MSTIKRFEDLNSWQEARELVKIVYTRARTGEISKDFGTKDQLRRATLSIMNNIAEGFGKTSTKEFIRYLSITESSATEVKSMAYVLGDLNYWEEKHVDELHQRIDSIRKKLRSFISYLNGYKAKLKK